MPTPITGATSSGSTSPGRLKSPCAPSRILKRICRTHLEGRYSIEVIDLIKNPQLAAGEQILALPTLVRRLPEPVKQVVGDLSNEERVLVGLDLRRSSQ